MIYFCCDALRRSAVRGGPLNGIDFIEVVDLDAPSEADRQRFLHVHLVNDPGALVVGVDNVRIEGGDRITGIDVLDVVTGLGPQTNVLVVEVDRPGDFSRYTLRLMRSALDARPPIGVDPQLAFATFSFKAECPSPFDCHAPCECPVEPRETPQIDYLAKDYESFRRVMLDRMALLAPQWRERNPADATVMLVELMAYVGDQLSYAQDAAHREAFLDHCVSRISARRLARLVDYQVGEGANARVHVHLAVDVDLVPANAGDPPVLPAGTAITTRLAKAGATIAVDPALITSASVVYETMHDVESLFAAHNEMAFYAWSDRRCCLPRGATRATLAGHLPELRVGETLIVEEIVGPRTGQPADADPANRQALRLTEVQAFDEGGVAPLVDPVTGDEVTEIAWHEADALRRALCVSAETDEAFGNAFIPIVSVARGNVVLADHGRTIAGEDLGTVPEPEFVFAEAETCDVCERPVARRAPPRFQPRLANAPVTHTAPLDPEAPAGEALVQDAAAALPALSLESLPDGLGWRAQRDLLASNAFADEFALEVENDGSAQVRFGDDVNGRRPEPGTRFVAEYRVGLGRAGSVGAEALRHAAIALPEVSLVRNPLPSTGGVEPESLHSVRALAPHAFRRQERAVTREDYASVSERLDTVQRAAATWRHTGSWLTVFLSADQVGGGPVDAGFAAALRDHVERFRLAGYDLEVDGPRFVPLEIELFVCVRPRRFRGDVRRALLAKLGSSTGPDGRPGLLHPDNLSFGQTVYLSPILAAAQSTPGVESVRASVFRRLGESDEGGLEDGFLEFERLEIARVDSDPNFPDRGVLTVELSGGL